MIDCTENGCVEAGRWQVGERRFCSTHGIQASIRGSAAMRLVCPVVGEDAVSIARGSWWDQLEAEYDAVVFGDPTDREQMIRAMLEAAIEHGRASA